MIRKAGHIILVVMLLVSTAGITVSRHYCGGNLSSVSIMTEPVSCCDMEGCCHNETQTYQIDDDFTATLLQFAFEQISIPVLKEYSLAYFELPSYFTCQIFYDGPSPPDSGRYLATIQTFIL